MPLRASVHSKLLLLVLGFFFLPLARADSFSVTGSFLADDSTYSYSFSPTITQSYTFSTSSYASGGIVPVLTLFNVTTGAPVDNAGTGVSDVSLTDTLGAGSYRLFLTEFPNVANGNLSAGFLFAGQPTITGDLCGVSGGKFYDSITCSQRSSAYALTVTSSSVTPEPPSWLLVLPPALLLCFSRRGKAFLNL